MRTKTLLLCILGTFSFLNFGDILANIPATTSGVLPLGQIINLASKNRFNSQRIGKAYILIASGQNSPSVKKELETGIMLIDENLKLIAVNAPNPKIKDEVKLVSNFWVIYKGIVSKAPSTEGVAQVLSGNTQFLDACNQLVMTLVDYSESTKPVSSTVSNKEIAQCINLSGRFRMLSQRLSMYHVAYYEGLTPDYKNIMSCVNEINNNIAILLASPANDTEVDGQLCDLIQTWKDIRDNTKDLIGKKKSSTDVCAWADEMLTVSEKLTKAYEKLLF